MRGPLLNIFRDPATLILPAVPFSAIFNVYDSIYVMKHLLLLCFTWLGCWNRSNLTVVLPSLIPSRPFSYSTLMSIPTIAESACVISSDIPTQMDQSHCRIEGSKPNWPIRFKQSLMRIPGTGVDQAISLFFTSLSEPVLEVFIGGFVKLSLTEGVTSLRPRSTQFRFLRERFRQKAAIVLYRDQWSLTKYSGQGEFWKSWLSAVGLAPNFVH